MKLWHACLAAVTLAFCAFPAHAATLFLPGTLDKTTFIPAKDAKGPYAISYAAASAETTGRTAATIKLQLTVAGPESATPTLFVLPLPANSGVKTGYTLVTADEKPVTIPVTFLGEAEAQKLFESIAKETGSPAILAYTGRDAIVAQLSLKDKTELILSYRAAVSDLQGVSVLDVPLPSTRFTRGPVDRLSLDVTVKSDRPVRAAFSPTHPVTIERKNLNEAAVTLKSDRYTGTDDFRLCFVSDADDLGLRLLTYRDNADPDGYFMLVGNPTGSASQKAVDKDVVFVLDSSGSMRGEKIEQARAAIDYCLTHLNPGDRFNVINFGTDVSSFKDDITANTPANIAAAREFVDNVVAQGRTNIGGALAKAFTGAADPARPRIMIFLTDGAPTAGELKPDVILASVAKENTSKTRVFVIGVGNDVNARLLEKLAEDTDGSTEYISPNEEIDAKVATLYDRLSNPVLTDVALDFGDLKSFSVYPKKLPALFKGSEIMVVGQYHEGGPHAVAITGTLNGKKHTYTAKADFPATPSTADTGFVAPVWAARKIGFLLSEIRLHADKPESNKELIEEVVRLSKKFGIITEYTDFIAAAPEMTAPMVADMAKAKMIEGRAQEAGQWAVNQAINAGELQLRNTAGNLGNTYRDRRGQIVSVDTIKQAGNRTYYLHDGQWSDGEAAGERKTRTVKYMSEEYLKLVHDNADFAKSQELSWSVSVNVGNERIVVERDGKTADEELKKIPAPVPAPAINQNQQPANNNAGNQLRNLNQVDNVNQLNNRN
jgi:uncharacterized protein YegL